MQSTDLGIVIAGNTAEYREIACKKLADICSAVIISASSLYHLADEHELWGYLGNSFSELVVADALHPRPLESLLHARGVSSSCIHCIDTRVFASAEELADSIYLLYCTDNPGQGKTVYFDAEPAERWYPVIDKYRCTNCTHCVQFCLFGVYSNDNCEVKVISPQSCKPGCPACSRICPQGAIIFPLYEKDPAIAGAPGRIMSPTPEAMEMYEKRTGKSLDEPEDEIDRLIDEFDKLQFGK